MSPLIAFFGILKEKGNGVGNVLSKEEFQKLTFENIEEETQRDGSRFWFEINGVLFSQHAFTNKQELNVYYIGTIYHHPRECPLCKVNYKEKCVLGEYQQDVFNQLIESISSRLLWLYRECKFL